jgi:hypothetical protein
MNKKTKIALIIGAAAIGGYFLWKSRQPEKKSASGCGCDKKSAIGRAGPVELPRFGRKVILRDR